jgi:CHAT domain-containing protein/tetratricopeptide (TPR) repeat protein
MILEHHRLLEWLPRSDPDRPTLLIQLVVLRTQRMTLSCQKLESDFNNAITHLTEAILLPPTQHIAFSLFDLAALLLSRFKFYQQADDVRSSIKYFRFLRINFHSLGAFDLTETRGDLSTHLFHALAHNLELIHGDMVQNLEEMVALIPEFITADVLTDHRQQAIEAFGVAVTVTEMFLREDTQQVANRAIQVLREAVAVNPDSVISYALCQCLTARFESTLAMSDYEEAMAIVGRLVSTHSPGNSPTTTQRNAMKLISMLLVSRLNSSPRPEHLEDAIHRIRTFVPYFQDHDRTELDHVLELCTQLRFKYFGVSGNSGGTRTNPNYEMHFTLKFQDSVRPVVDPRPQITETMSHLEEVATAIKTGKITDVEAAVEHSRKLIPLQQSAGPPSFGPAGSFAYILFQAYRCTKRPDYLNEAITTYRGLRNRSAPTNLRFHAGHRLLWMLAARLGLSPCQQDIEELVQLCSELASDDSGEVFTRFEIPCLWATVARLYQHPSASIAYETAMSLLQETLFFCPTLQIQHLRLTQVLGVVWRLPSDFASYQIGNGQVTQAIETLERGRALIWSEMRGLRTSTDQLRAADPALADNFADINRRLESVTMSVAQSDDDGIGHSEAGIGCREHSIGHLVLMQRRLFEERNSLITHIQSLPGFEHFLEQPSFDSLNSAASHGPVIIVNQSKADFPSHIIILLKDSRPFIISTSSSFHDRANQLENKLLRVRKEKGLDSEDYDLTLASVLSGLYELVGKPVIESLCKLKVREKSRVWWCPTGAFCSLPLHAMGPIPLDDGKERYFSDLYIASYTPTLSALIESRKRGPFYDASDKSKPSILLVAQPDTLPGAFGEITVIQSTKTPVTTLISAMATPATVTEGLMDHRFAHFVCHGLLEIGKPFDASLELHKDNLTLLAIIRSQLPAAEFAFLSACHTAELTEGTAAEEGLHLAAAMQFCGFRSVVGTMWAMADTDGADLSKHFYKTLFSDNSKAGRNGVPYHERSARALQIAVKKLRKKRGMTLERWVNFVHYGA